MTVRALDEPVATPDARCRRSRGHRVECSNGSARRGAAASASLTPSRRQARNRIRAPIRAGRAGDFRDDVSVIETAPRALFCQAVRCAPGEGRARVDAESGRVRALLVSLPRLSAREAADVDDDRRPQRDLSRSGTASSSSARDENGATIFPISSGRSAQHLSDDDGCRSVVEVAQGKAGKKRSSGLSITCLPGRERDGERVVRQDSADDRTVSKSASERRIPTRGIRRSPSRTLSSAAWKTRRRRRKPTERCTTSSRTSTFRAIRWFRTNSPTNGSAILLTCRDWSHAWLNEGFATFMEAVWREADLGIRRISLRHLRVPCDVS